MQICERRWASRSDRILFYIGVLTYSAIKFGRFSNYLIILNDILFKDIIIF